MEFEFYKKSTEIKEKIDAIIDVVYEDEITNHSKTIDARELSKDFKKRILDKLKDFKSFKKSEYFKNYSFQQESGTYHITLVLRKSIKAFELQTAIRKSLGGVAKDLKTIVLNLDEVSKAHQEMFVDDFAAFLKILEWKSPAYGKKAKDSKEPKKESSKKKTYVHSQIKEDELKSLTDKGAILGEANNLVRTLAMMPANILNPKKYQEILQERAQKGKYIYRFIDVEKLQKMGAGAFLAVVAADPSTESGIAHISYKPKNKSLGKICLVGKGLCFDTGGYDIKTSHMYGMHRDMTGSAVVLALFEALVKMQAPYEIHGILAIAENFISPTGYKPNDVVIAMNGTSIEVVNTDAEGRMVLSDALCYASELKPDLILDYATLTGSAVRAIGTARSVIFTNNKKLLKLAVIAGEHTGERTWAFPMGEDYAEALKSDVADIKQCASGPSPDHILAATFLSEFVEEPTPWLHVDLSSDGHTGGLGLVDSEVTGFGVRYGLEVIQKFIP